MSDPSVTAPRGSPLTPQETRVMDALSILGRVGDVAKLLGLSPHTVSAYARNARHRYGVKTTYQAIAKHVALHGYPEA